MLLWVLIYVGSSGVWYFVVSLIKLECYFLLWMLWWVRWEIFFVGKKISILLVCSCWFICCSVVLVVWLWILFIGINSEFRGLRWVSMWLVIILILWCMWDIVYRSVRLLRVLVGWLVIMISGLYLGICLRLCVGMV